MAAHAGLLVGEGLVPGHRPRRRGLRVWRARRRQGGGGVAPAVRRMDSVFPIERGDAEPVKGIERKRLCTQRNIISAVGKTPRTSLARLTIFETAKPQQMRKLQLATRPRMRPLVQTTNA